MRITRNLGRRKLRTTLTVLGITIGIWALVVFSSMANKINSLVEGGNDFYAGKVVVSDDANIGIGMEGVPIDLSVADEIRDLGGVAAVDAQVHLVLDEDAGPGMGMPDLITGSVAGADEGLSQTKYSLATGRMLAAADEGAHVTVLGSELARKFAVVVGQTIELRGVAFETVGVLEPTLSTADTTAMVPLAAAQGLFIETLPLVVRESTAGNRLASQIVVYPAAGTNDVALAQAIEQNAINVRALTSVDFDQQVGASVGIFNAIIIGVATISLVVGGLSVINTMAMSVAERTREIGIKRAIGGSRSRIIRELVGEAAVIGLIGGLAGLVLGGAVVLVANEVGRSSGNVLFDLTPGTAAFAVAFSTVLGMLAGIVPAWSAARLDPVSALRYE
ncbi:MAG: ABC transporter permease [Chloroflexi bacterium]|nr:ABC transporter permease [Chloroflexota bacterium]